MKRTIYIFIIINCFARLTSAQVIGADSVCSGYLYTYTANIPGADSISWTLPAGWYIINSSGTQVEVLCNQNTGQICADGFDSLGNHLSQVCKPVSWGGGGLGWDAQPVPVTFCQCPDYDVQIIPNSLSQCGSCSAGTISPNLRYAVYDGPWPTGIFQMYAGVTTLPSPLVFTTYYVYLVDITFGIANAILIDGGLCPATINNTFTLAACWYSHLLIHQTPDPVCTGDTLTLQYDTTSAFPLNSYSWWVSVGNVSLIPPLNQDHIQCIINSASPVDIILSGYDMMGCPYSGEIVPNYIVCNAQLPVAAFQPGDSEICEGSCVDFINASSNATEYHWLFPGGSPSSDTATNPHGICYSNSGTFNATLIATNSAGSDTITINNFLIVHPQVAFSPLTQHGDTLFCTPGLANYQWYLDTTIIPGANIYYYVVTQSGDYSVEITDSNGCTALAKLLGVIASVNDIQFQVENFTASILDDNILLNINSTFSSSCKIQLTDIYGKEIYSNDFFTVVGKNSVELSGLNISEGIYFIVIKDDKHSMSQKIFIPSKK